MSTKRQSIIDKAKANCRRTFKHEAIRKATRQMGGPEVRRVRRAERLDAIREEKERLRSSLLTSWQLGEIPQPDPQTLKEFQLGYPVTIGRLRELHHHYWGWQTRTDI